jgi:hypothetical protein
VAPRLLTAWRRNWKILLMANISIGGLGTQRRHPCTAERLSVRWACKHSQTGTKLFESLPSIWYMERVFAFRGNLLRMYQREFWSFEIVFMDSLMYRVYTKEWCGFNSEYYWNRTIILCMPCITAIKVTFKDWRLLVYDAVLTDSYLPVISEKSWIFLNSYIRNSNLGNVML